jgi:hypothetical protein
VLEQGEHVNPPPPTFHDSYLFRLMITLALCLMRGKTQMVRDIPKVRGLKMRGLILGPLFCKFLHLGAFSYTKASLSKGKKEGK